MQATTIQVIQAIATISAVTVALGIATVPVVIRRIRRPKLAILVGDDEPHMRPEWNPEVLEMSAVVLRLQVMNVGRREARGVRVHVRRWWAELPPELLPGWHWIEYDIDPIPLVWVSRPLPDSYNAEMLESSLPAGISDLVELAWNDASKDTVSLCSPDGRPRPFSLEAEHAAGEYRIEVKRGVG